MTVGRRLEELTSRFRLCGLSGDLEGFFSAFSEATDLAEEVRSDTQSRANCWLPLLRFDLETSNVSAVVGDLASIDPSQSANPSMIEAIREFVTKHVEALGQTREAIFELERRRQLEIKEDLCIGTWFRLLLLPEEFNSSRDIWRYTVDAAIKVATAKNVTTFLLPDYLEPLIRRNQRFFSFHTNGQRPGVVHFKPSDFPRRVIIDEGGYSGWSTLAKTRLQDLELPELDVSEAFYLAHKEEVLRGNISKYSQKPLRDFPAWPNQFIFVALQVAADRTQQLARVPMLEMLNIVVRQFHGTDTKVVVKRHPLCSDSAIAERLEDLSRSGKIILTDASIHQIMPCCRGVCTVNSGVGAEAIVYLKPIYLFGEADYNCIAHRISRQQDFAEAIAAGQLPCSESDMKRFLYYYRNIYQVQVDDPQHLTSFIAERLFPEN